MSTAKETVESLLTIFNGFIYSPAIWLFKGIVLFKLWGWYVTPATGLASPPVGICMGLLILPCIFQVVPPFYKDHEWKTDPLSSCVRTTIYAAMAALALLFGWILTFLLPYLNSINV